MLKKTKAIVIVICLVLVALFIIPASLGANDTIYTSFGQFRVEVSNVDSSTGEEVRMKPSSILGDMLEFTRAGVEVGEINVKIFVTATGEGFDACEFDLSESSKLPEINTRLMEGGSVIDTDTQTYSGADYLIFPLGSEQLFWEYTCDINEFESSFDTSDDHSFVVEISFDYPGCTYRGKYTGGGTGDTINLPVEGTSDISWEQTWNSPVYMGDFTYTATRISDVHNKYKNADSNWVEFDNNYWNSGTVWTDTIDDYVYGIHLAGWVSGDICTYHWTQYTDASGGICTSVPLGGTSGGSGDWQTSDVSFIVETGTSLEWNTEVSCGDGSCDDYLGENCWTCPGDCGSCDTRIIHQTFSTSGSLTKDVCSPRADRYNPDTNSWDEWMYYHRTSDCTYTPRYYVPFWIYPFGPETVFEVYVRTDAVGTLTATCEVTSPSGDTKQLYYTSWSDIEDPGGIEITSSMIGDWFSIGWETGCGGCSNPHVIDEDGDWDINFQCTLASAGMTTLTIEPQQMAYENGATLPIVTVDGITDSTEPYEFQLWGNINYYVDIDWYGNGITETTHSVFLPYADYTYSAPHPDKWRIVGVAFPNVPYDWSISNPQWGADTTHHDMNPSFWYNLPSTSSEYTVRLFDTSGGDPLDEHIFDISSGHDAVWIFNQGLQMVTMNTFSIVSESNNFKPYEFNGNTLGGH